MRIHNDTTFVLYTFSVVTLAQSETRTHTHDCTVYISFNDIASLSNKTFATSFCYFNIIVARGQFTQHSHIVKDRGREESKR